MFDPKRIERLLELQEKTYGLFLWVNRSLRSGTSKFEEVESALSFADAATRWLRDHASSLPAACRPAPGEETAFANLFVSYLSTSFEIIDNLEVGVCGGCFCCGALRLPRHLRVRNPDRKARGEAQAMKVLHLRQIADEEGHSRTDEEIRNFLRRNPQLREAVAMTTYVRELERRTKFASQGAAPLALWREFAWTPGGRPRRGFRLKPEDVVKADRAVRDRLSGENAS